MGGLAWGPGMAPQIGVPSGPEKTPPMPRPDASWAPVQIGQVGDDLPDVSRASREGPNEHTPVVQFIVDGGGKANAVAGPFEQDVQARETSEAAWEHGATRGGCIAWQSAGTGRGGQGSWHGGRKEGR